MICDLMINVDDAFLNWEKHRRNFGSISAVPNPSLKIMIGPINPYHDLSGDIPVSVLGICSLSIYSVSMCHEIRPAFLTVMVRLGGDLVARLSSRILEIGLSILLPNRRNPSLVALHMSLQFFS